MSQVLDLTQKEPCVADRGMTSPEVWIHGGRCAGVNLLQRGKRLVALRPFYDDRRGYGKRRLLMFHLPTPGGYVATSYGGDYAVRLLVLFELTDAREIVVVGKGSTPEEIREKVAEWMRRDVVTQE